MAIAALRAHASGKQITHAGKPGERGRLASEGDTQPGEFGESASHHCGAGVVAGAEAVGHPGGKRDHVLQGAAELTADHVGARVHPEQLGREKDLEPLSDRVVGEGDHRSGSATRKDLLGEVGAGEHADGVTGQFFLDKFGHAFPGAELEPLGERHDRHPRPQVRSKCREGVAETARRHTHDHEVGLCHHRSKVVGGLQLGMELVPREIGRVLVAVVDRLGGLGPAGIDRGGSVVGAQMGDRGAP